MASELLPFLRKPMEPGENVNPILDARAQKEGGFAASLSWTDRQRLRAVVKRVHMKHYPTEMITDREADKMIEAIAPETARYLIERNWEALR
jgi:hypothetical protein